MKIISPTFHHSLAIFLVEHVKKKKKKLDFV
jgi:hypothetical protein